MAEIDKKARISVTKTTRPTGVQAKIELAFAGQICAFLSNGGTPPDIPRSLSRNGLDIKRMGHLVRSQEGFKDVFEYPLSEYLNSILTVMQKAKVRPKHDNKKEALGQKKLVIDRTEIIKAQLIRVKAQLIRAHPELEYRIKLAEFAKSHTSEEISREILSYPKVIRDKIEYIGLSK